MRRNTVAYQIDMAKSRKVSKWFPIRFPISRQKSGENSARGRVRKGMVKRIDDDGRSPEYRVVYMRVFL